MRGTPRIVVGLALSILVVSCGSAKTTRTEPFRGAVITPPRRVAQVSLPDASNGNRPFSFRAEDGHLLLVYFGFTNCPDICPTTLSDIRKALASPDLARHEGKVDLAMITVDPERDTGPLLTRYLAGFHEGAHALRTDDPDALGRAAAAFGATYSVVEPGHGLPPEVGHSAITYGVNDLGQLIAHWPFGTPSADFAHDFTMILDGKPLTQLSESP